MGERTPRLFLLFHRQEIAARLLQAKLETIQAQYQRMVVLKEEKEEAAVAAASAYGLSQAPVPPAQQHLWHSARAATAVA
ncbi:hypothetical protein NDU88_007224 [Pleurodeles waltl]|uniref:Uncharacterized protein n=1 Tax=Pleurodeles waltl TaxID=8319 RepID=A0AAV7U2V7_PLEWA|nr:hypothetical protein NDU88_007224 [Pleurodeles waltl]